MTPDQKKALKVAKNNHTLHVALIEREGHGKSDAIALAYSEGAAGLNARLNPERKS